MTWRSPALLLAIAACGGSQSPPAPDAAAPTDVVGPRALPTFVPLEIDDFPRPASEACAGTTVVDVAAPQSITEALATAAPGTTLRVAPGTYTERAAEPYALEWEVDDVCLRAADGGLVVVQAAPGQKYGISLRGDGAVLEGVTLRGFEVGIAIEGDVGETRRAITIERTTIEAATGAFREGIVAYGDNQGATGRPPTVDGLLLLDVVVDGADLGVSCNAGPCAHWWVERTRITGRRGAATSGAYAFAIEDGRQIAVVDVSVENAEADGVDTKADDVVVLATRVLGVGRNGIKLWRGGDVLDSVVDGSGADAALVGAEGGRYRYAHVLVTGHDPAGTGYVGTWAYDTPEAPVELEIVDSIFVANAAGGLFVPSGADVSLRHNLFGDAGDQLLDRQGTLYDVADLARLEADGLGAANLAADPRLDDDWTPAADSPTRDAGEVVPGLDRDLLGNPRVVGAAPDLGPIERW